MPLRGSRGAQIPLLSELYRLQSVGRDKGPASGPLIFKGPRFQPAEVKGRGMTRRDLGLGVRIVFGGYWHQWSDIMMMIMMMRTAAFRSVPPPHPPFPPNKLKVLGVRSYEACCQSVLPVVQSFCKVYHIYFGEICLTFCSFVTSD